MLEKLYHLAENGTDVKTEVIAGITTFMTMAYILAVNPAILSVTGMDGGAIFVATALGAFVGTVLMAMLSNYPFALAPGMGLNAFFAFTVCGQMGYPWQLGLAAVFVEGILFILLSVTPVRESIFNAIPMGLKCGVSAGIGLFIAFIGLQTSKFVVDNPATLVGIYNFKAAIADGSIYSTGMGVLLCVFGVFLISILMAKKVKGAILIGILGTYVVTIILQMVGLYVPNPSAGMYSAYPNFSNFGIPSLAPTFMQFDFTQLFSFNFVTIMLTFMFVDLFDTLGTLIGVASKADMLDEQGKLPRIQGALLADSIATVAGAVLGTTTVTTYVESSAGVIEGGRTGLTAVVTAILFLVSLVFAPIFLAIPGFCTAPALIVVGFMMASGLLRVNFDDITEALPAYIAAIAMPFFYSISEGISMGVITYTVMNLLGGMRVNGVMLILTALFVLKYIFI
ncbi:MAG: NCS2 family permease [Phascolarctobacterium sp.]|nr:NCS2 family permease [Candidatus Phascolarctobacterium caballi]